MISKRLEYMGLGGLRPSRESVSMQVQQPYKEENKPQLGGLKNVTFFAWKLLIYYKSTNQA